MAADNLPSPSTPFIGRVDEIRELTELLVDPRCRLLTLTGLGGIGKTRLALRLTEQIEHRFRDGVHFVPLQSLESSDQILSTLITTLAIQADSAPRNRLLAWLREKHLLLVLDNFEHLTEGVDLLIDILETTPDVKLLVTSRDPLRLRGEWLHRLSGLDFPEADCRGPYSNYSAVQLFVERVRQQDYHVNIEAQFSHIVRLCQLVEGMPLALELAAGWIHALSCAEMVAELEHSITLLKSHVRDIPNRHSSIEAVFAHSWRLLTDEERVVLQGCSVFRGGCTRDAAEQITGAHLLVLVSLVEKSLLRHDSDSGRFYLHELLRQYAAEKLERAPGLKEIILERHCRYYAEFLHRYAAVIHLGNQTDALAEIDNLRAAWRYASQQSRQVALLQASPSLHWLYHFQGWYDEGAAMFRLAEDALCKVAVTDDSRFLLGAMRLYRCFFQREQPGQIDRLQDDIETALALWSGLDERREMGLPLTRAMLCTRSIEKLPSVARRALAFSRRHDDLPGVAISLTTLAHVTYMTLSDLAEAQRLLEEALALDQQIGFHLNARWVEVLLGQIASLQGRYREAKAHAEACVAHHRAGGIFRLLDLHLFDIGKAALELNEDAEARRYFAEGIEVASTLRRQVAVTQGRACLGIAASFQGDTTAAAEYYEQCHADLRTLGESAFSVGNEVNELGFLALLRGQYEAALRHYEAELSALGETGYRMPLMCARTRAGHALIGLSDETRAQRYLFDAMREAQTAGTVQVQLEAIVGIAQLTCVPPGVAVAMLALASKHAAANRYSRSRAKQLLSTMEARVPQDKFAAALEQGQSLTPEAATALLEPFEVDSHTAKVGAHQSLLDPLSARELEVVALIAAGYTNHEIAGQLHVGISTVKKHINHIYDKLDVTHRAQAVARARSLHLLR